MLFRLGSGDRPTVFWSDVLCSVVIARFGWDLAYGGLLRGAGLLALLIVALVCLFLLARNIGRSTLTLAALVFYVADLAFTRPPYVVLFLVFCVVVVAVALVLGPVFRARS